MPLQGTFIVGKQQAYEGADWEFAVTPTRPPSPYWKVLVRSDPKQEPRIQMTWDVPPPF
jgi:hypothetical protein